MNWIRNNEWLKPVDDHQVRWGQLRRFAANYRSFRTPLLAAAFLALLGSATAFAIPVVFFRLQQALTWRQFGLLTLALAVYLGILLFEIATTYGIRVIRSHISTRLNRELVLQYYGKILNLEIEEFIAFRQRTNLFQRVIDAMAITPQFTDFLVHGGRSAIVLVVVGAAIALLSPQVLAVLVVGSALLFTYMVIRSRELRELRQRTIALNYPLVGKMIEVINGLFTIKTLSASVRVTSDVSELVSGRTAADYDEQKVEAGALQFATAIRQVVLLFAIAEAIVLLVTDRLLFSEVLSLYILAGLFLQPVSDLAVMYQSLSRLSVNVQAFYEVLDLRDETAAVPASFPSSGRVVRVAVAEPQRAAAAVGAAGGNGRGAGFVPAPAAPALNDDGTPSGHIVFSDLEFAYRDGSPVLSDVDLEIQAGERVSLIGRSGVGKTTLLRLLLGLLHPQRGRILVDGVDVATWTDRNAYRRQFGVVSQHDVLFGVSIRENLTFGLHEQVPDERMEEALRMVDLWSDVERLPEGLGARYSADMFSGGQKQRFFIARALLRQPSIVLLDEPTSALDFENEGKVIQAVDRLVGGKTTITIAHRLSTVHSSDRVVVMDRGGIRGSGTHEELYRDNDYYRALCDYNSFVV